MEIIRLDRVSLWRRTQEEFSYDLKKTVLSFMEGKYRQPARKLVLDQVSLAVEAGEKIGILGANGSGKSTLLKIICNILQPTSGRVWVKGTVAPLIELGAGFDQELSVTDNIVLYGVMLGFSELEMREKSQSILEFAELEDYADIPVKALSSGMVARLGFAIATDILPSILILDEVLSVGDERFKNKCRQRIEKFWNRDTTVLLVSHELKFLKKSCQRVIWLDRGRVKMVGDAATIVDIYLNSIDSLGKRVTRPMNRSTQTRAQIAATRNQPIKVEFPSEERLTRLPESLSGVTLSQVFLAGLDKQAIATVTTGSAFYIGIDFKVEYPISNLRLSFYLENDQGEILLAPVINSWQPETQLLCTPGQHCVYAKVPAHLVSGIYYVSDLSLYEKGIGQHQVLVGRQLVVSVLPSEEKSPPVLEDNWVDFSISWSLERP